MTREGIQCYPEDPQAVQWCFLGAARRVGRESTGFFTGVWLDEVCQAVGMNRHVVPNWNDSFTRRQEDVIERLDEAIGRALLECARGQKP